MSWFSDKIGFKNPFKKENWKSWLGIGSGGMLPGFEWGSNTKIGDAVLDPIYKGVGNLVTGGYIGQREAAEQQKDAAGDAKRRYAREQAAAEETARKIAEAEEERKRRLAAMGTQTPATLYGTYLGISSIKRSMLG
jgi:hypothetical protein